MEAFFDNKTNIINAHICAVRDDAVMYTLETKFEFGGRVRTVLRDENPLPGSSSAVVGAINWKDKTIEANGHKRKCEDLRRTTGFLFTRKQFWRWSSTRIEYELSYTHEEWKATTEEGKTTAGTFITPFRPHLFGPSKRPIIKLSQTALLEDEVFLLMVFIYEEVKRQDRTNTSLSGGTSSW
ncbi:hypothetical protein R3P38DRAFT_2502203 [Favolaschia claudopus]|uniref:Uncharacterized protein n=1 Tax=Favolaschia claudopus TaxID=2862362 RepID=A0AAW0DNQ7_9AGAR